ncbi:MAG: VCBS repeat-containing protein, partial [Acidimicrobiia bacterium]|nr:VCBS repeat-containing protein [Acidimicrobiia bacterium]
MCGVLVTLVACTTSPATTESSGPTSSTTSTTFFGSPGGGDGYDLCWTSPTSGSVAQIQLVDATAEFGLVDPLIGMKGHAAAWGDVNGDGFVDLFFGTFATSRNDVYLERGATGPAPDRILVQDDGSFTTFAGFPEEFGRTSGAAMADLDGDGDLDLVLSRNVNERQGGVPSEVFENTGGSFVSADAGIDPGLGGRSIGVLDVDADGLLDLVIVEDRYTNGSTRIYRNLGGLEFEDVSESIGFPTDVHGLGVVTADFNLDGFTDFFVAGSNRLFTGSEAGLVEVDAAIPEWETFGPEDDVAGVAAADVNRDGRIDLLVGHHYNSTLSRGTEVPVQLYLNTSSAGGAPQFENVTVAAGLVGTPTKAPHVELVDVDNDGWLDVVTSASASDGSSLAIFRLAGVSGGVPQFETPAGMGSAQYWVSAPSADVDRDGDLDFLAVEWEPSLPSILFRNDSGGGHWIDVVVGDERGGIGTRVEIYRAGGAGDGSALLGVREIAATVGYTAGIELSAHFGLGDVAVVDVVVSPPFGSDPTILHDVPADGRIGVGGGC